MRVLGDLERDAFSGIGEGLSVSSRGRRSADDERQELLWWAAVVGVTDADVLYGVVTLTQPRGDSATVLEGDVDGADKPPSSIATVISGAAG